MSLFEFLMKVRCYKTTLLMVISLALCLGLLTTPSHAQNIAKRFQEVRLVECLDKTLGFKILCSAEWDKSRDKESVTLYIERNDEETVTLTITNPDETGLDYEDLTPSALKYVFNYADGFKYTRTSFHPQQAIFVKAQPVDDPNGILLDYFLLRDTQLYRIGFYVRPDYKFDKYYRLFIKMIRSFQFIDK